MYNEVTINNKEQYNIKQWILDDKNQNYDNSIITDEEYYYNANEAEEEKNNAVNLEEGVSNNEMQRDSFKREIKNISINKQRDDDEKIGAEDPGEEEDENDGGTYNGGTEDKEQEQEKHEQYTVDKSNKNDE